MTDAEFIARLESCRLREDEFDHAAHVRAGYLYLRHHRFPQALARMCAAIEAYAASVGRADRYHETMTIGFMALIHERICKRGDGGDWQGFSDQNPEIFRRDILLNYYPRDLLESAEARARLVLVPIPRQAKSAPNS